MTRATTRSFRPPVPNLRTVLFWTAVVLFESLLVLTYVTVQGAEFGLFHVYPFIWINVGLWAVWQTNPRTAPRGRKSIAGTIAVGYFLLLGYVGGLFSEGHSHHDHHEQIHESHAEFLYGLDMTITAPPGYGPAVFYSSPDLLLAVSPYNFVGYVALAYLIYATILDIYNAALPGVLGLFTCITCSWPLLATIATGVGGATGAVATTVYSQAYGISTVAFVLTVGLLYWRPFARD